MVKDVKKEAAEIGMRHNGTVVAIGKFDGVHRGHQGIINLLKGLAQKDGLGSVILTFENNPLSVLNPSACPRPLMSPNQRRHALLREGIDDVLMVPFTRQLADESAESFVAEYLVECLKAQHVIVGDDFRFGRGAQGTPRLLEELGKKYGFTVDIVAEIADTGLGRVSSSLIRQKLDAGSVAEAHRLLGHPHYVSGSVVHGDARGRELGFPTANLGASHGEESVEGYIPADGVYAGIAIVDDKSYQAAISVGNNPTFTPDALPRVEAYLLDFDADIYGAEIEIRFFNKVRGMETFDSVDALIDRMDEDILQVRNLLQTNIK